MEYNASYIVPSNDIYTAEKILKKRKTTHGIFEYLVKWKGYSKKESTWEPEFNILDPMLLDEFLAKCLAKQTAMCNMKCRLRRKNKNEEENVNDSSALRRSARVSAKESRKSASSRREKRKRFKMRIGALLCKKMKVENVIKALKEEKDQKISAEESKDLSSEELRLIISRKDGLLNIINGQKEAGIEPSSQVTKNRNEPIYKGRQVGEKLIDIGHAKLVQNVDHNKLDDYVFPLSPPPSIRSLDGSSPDLWLGETELKPKTILSNTEPSSSNQVLKEGQWQSPPPRTISIIQYSTKRQGLPVIVQSKYHQKENASNGCQGEDRGQAVKKIRGNKCSDSVRTGDKKVRRRPKAIANTNDGINQRHEIPSVVTMSSSCSEVRNITAPPNWVNNHSRPFVNVTSPLCSPTQTTYLTNTTNSCCLERNQNTFSIENIMAPHHTAPHYKGRSLAMRPVMNDYFIRPLLAQSYVPFHGHTGGAGMYNVMERKVLITDVTARSTTVTFQELDTF